MIGSVSRTRGHGDAPSSLIFHQRSTVTARNSTPVPLCLRPHIHASTSNHRRCRKSLPHRGSATAAYRVCSHCCTFWCTPLLSVHLAADGPRSWFGRKTHVLSRSAVIYDIFRCCRHVRQLKRTLCSCAHIAKSRTENDPCLSRGVADVQKRSYLSWYCIFIGARPFRAEAGHAHTKNELVLSRWYAVDILLQRYSFVAPE